MISLKLQIIVTWKDFISGLKARGLKLKVDGSGKKRKILAGDLKKRKEEPLENSIIFHSHPHLHE